MTLKMPLDFVENIVIFVSAFRKPGALLHLPHTIQPEKRPLQYGQYLLIAQLENLCHCSLDLCIDLQTKMTRKYSARSVHTCKIRWSIYTPWRSDEHISRIGIFNNNIKSSFEADIIVYNCAILTEQISSKICFEIGSKYYFSPFPRNPQVWSATLFSRTAYSKAMEAAGDEKIHMLRFLG